MSDDAGPDSERDWIADFAGTAKTDAQLKEWERTLRGPRNDELRQLVQEAQCMRWVARVLFQRLHNAGAWPLPDGKHDEELRLVVWLLERRK